MGGSPTRCYGRVCQSEAAHSGRPPGAGPADKAAFDAERARVEALHISIGSEYAAQALPVIREHLARAGYRLAGVLNQTFR